MRTLTHTHTDFVTECKHTHTQKEESQEEKTSTDIRLCTTRCIHVQCMCTIFPTYTVMHYFVLYKVLLISKHCLATETRGLGMEGAPILQVGERIGIATAIAKYR